MNRILLPEFNTIIHTTPELVDRYGEFWVELGKLDKNLRVHEETDNPARCEGMLWRMKPLFEDGVELVLCRDLDSVVTYREACCIREWLNSHYSYHNINDNNAHGGLMGGLVGFKAKDFLKIGYPSFSHLIAGLDLSQHGSDQHFLNRKILPKIKNLLMFHRFAGAGCDAAKTIMSVSTNLVDKKFWVADFVSRYIGTAGVIEFELMRFFRSVDNSTQFNMFERRFPQIFYWV
jgi:hypothetical protein